MITRVKHKYETIEWPHIQLGIPDFSTKTLIIDDEGNVPVVKDIEGKRDPVWSLPGGGVEGSELPPETGSRESEEESGVLILPENFYPQTTEWVSFFAKIFDNHVRYFLVARPHSFIDSLKERGEEGELVNYFDIAKILEMDNTEFLPHHKLFIADFVEEMNEWI